MCHRLGSGTIQPRMCGRRPGPTGKARHHCWGGPEEEGQDCYRNAFLCTHMGSWVTGCLLHRKMLGAGANRCSHLGLQRWAWPATTRVLMNRHYLWPRSPQGLPLRRALQPSSTHCLHSPECTHPTVSAAKCSGNILHLPEDNCHCPGPCNQE